MFFGPYSFLIHPVCNWSTLVSGGSGAVEGLFVDVLARRDLQFQNIGASTRLVKASEPSSQEKPPSMLVPRVVTPFSRHFGMRTFFSSTMLSDVRRLDIWRNDSRCPGLRIIHLDGSEDILGQWDPSKDSSISTIYDTRDGPLLRLSFWFTKSEEWTPRVADIRVNDPEKNTFDHGVRCFQAREMNEVFIVCAQCGPRVDFASLLISLAIDPPRVVVYRELRRRSAGG